MEKNSILIFVILCLAGCAKSSQEASISGEITGLGNDTLFVYGMDEWHDRVDTIFAKEDKFVYTLPVDTLTPVYLLLNNRSEYPLYLDKGDRIKIKGDIRDAEHLRVEGNAYNKELADFQEALKQPEASSDEEKEQKAEDFIRQHPTSVVSLYVLDKYFVRKPEPDWTKIKALAEGMSGILQDNAYIQRLNGEIAQLEKVEIGKYAPFFSLPDEKGTKITRSSEELKKRCLLIHFWASWNEESATHVAELRELYGKYKKNPYFALLGISLDLDKKEWIEGIKRDTLDWKQVCDFGGFNSDAMKQYAINRLPANVLLSSEGKILARDLWGKPLREEVEKAVAAAETKEKKK